MSPMMGRASVSYTLPFSTTVYPPWVRISSFTASSISVSLSPITMMLWESCDTLDATAPPLKPKPATTPTPVLPVPLCRSTTAILLYSLSAVNSFLPGMLHTTSFVTICPSCIWITWKGPSGFSSFKLSLENVSRCTVCLSSSGHCKTP